MDQLPSSLLNRRRLLVAGLLLLFALFAGRLTHTAAEKSLTLDEPHYIGTGLYLWESGDYHFAKVLRYHPPLAFHLASLPLLLLNIEAPALGPEVGKRLLERGDPSLAAIRLASRIPFILLACWGMAICFWWARQVSGDVAGLIAAFLFSFSPTILANASLAHSDITVTVFFLQTLYAFWRWMVRPTALRLVACGASLGLALLAKASAILLLPILGVLLAAGTAGWLEGPGHGNGAGTIWLRRAGSFVAMLAVATFVLWIGYGCSFAIVEAPVVGHGTLRLPGFVHSLLLVDHANRIGRTIYFLGSFSNEGSWYFYPVALALKTPVAFQALLLIALSRRHGSSSRLGPSLWIPIAIYSAVMVFWLRVPLGIRYALPLFPLFFVFIATRMRGLRRWWQQAAVACACLWMAGSSLWIHPHYLAYFNEWTGGPAHADRYLLDSNLDWGQDLSTLARELAKRGSRDVWIAYLGFEKPEMYGLRARPLPGCDPVEGWVAISLNVFRGLYTAHSAFTSVPEGCYSWLADYEPVARPGYSMLLFDTRPGGGSHSR